ncbi:hypothetical protein AMAG_15366 [Allomyces macrogynus ATCC 38327]|uniref:Histone H1 n=1 Tax=Allomyces macrogynus (strain ATCC 38327) TaxID=578462 RepID=A0A0L0T7D5_ALLM3|nr:hypothetical protein AMAG_15366 [Allomyces macrogynus ATCC 38327]|eukprot:KNE70606.1 hypothetical protein AMAG_15366 [Allomyces macrogynus ATCC 38327]
MFPLASTPPPSAASRPSSAGSTHGNALLDALAPPLPPPLPRRHRCVNDDRPSSAMVMDVDDDEDDGDWEPPRAEQSVLAVDRAVGGTSSSVASPRDARRLPENTPKSWIALDEMMEDVGNDDDDDDDDYLSDEEDGEDDEMEEGRTPAMVARATATPAASSGCKGDHGTRSTARGDHDARRGGVSGSSSDGNSSDGDRDAEEDLDDDDEYRDEDTRARTRDAAAPPPPPPTTLQHPSQLAAARSRRGSPGATASQTVATPAQPTTATAAPPQTSHHGPLLPDQDDGAFVGGGDVDLVPSYEEMIAQAITALGDPQGHPPREIYAWMAMTYGAYLPVQFKGSATQALKKAWRKSRFLRDNRRYRLNPDYQGARVRGRAKPNAAITPMTDADRLRAAEAVRAATASGSSADASGGGASGDARRRSGKSRSKKKKPAAAHDDHGHIDQYGDAHDLGGGRTFTLVHPAMTHHLDQQQQPPIDEGVSLVSRPTSSSGTHTSPDLGAASTTTVPGTPGRPPRKRARTAPEPTASATTTTGGGWPIQLTSPPSLALRAGKRAPPPPSIMIPPSHSAAGELSSPTLILERMRLDHTHASSVASPTTSEYATHLPTPMLPATSTTSPTQHTHVVPAPYSVFAPAPAFHPHGGAAVAHHYATGLMSPMSPFMPASSAAVRPATAPVDPAAVLRDQCINPQALVNPLPLPVSPEDAEFGARIVSAMHAAADAAAAAAASAATAVADPMLVCMSPAATGIGARPSRRRFVDPDEHVPTLGAVPRDLVVPVPGIEMLGDSGAVPAAAHLMPTPAASLESVASPPVFSAAVPGTGGETMYLDAHTAALVAIAYHQQQQQQQVVVVEAELTAAAAASAFLASPPLVPLDATPAGSSLYLGSSATTDVPGMPLDLSLADAHGNATAAGQLVAAWMSTLQYASAATAQFPNEMPATSASGNGTYWDASSAAAAAAACAAGMAMDVDVVATPSGYLAAAFGDAVGDAPTPVLSAAAAVRASATAGMPSQ